MAIFSTFSGQVQNLMLKHDYLRETIKNPPKRCGVKEAHGNPQYPIKHLPEINKVTLHVLTERSFFRPSA